MPILSRNVSLFCLIMLLFTSRGSVRRYCSVRLREIISRCSGKAGSTPAPLHTILPLYNLADSSAYPFTGFAEIPHGRLYRGMPQ